MYSKAHRGPKLSLLSINWPIFVQNEVKIWSTSAKIAVKFPKSQNSYQYCQSKLVVRFACTGFPFHIFYTARYIEDLNYQCYP